jgi:hypothetical protein
VQNKHSFLDDKNNPCGPTPQFLDTRVRLPTRRKIVSKENNYSRVEQTSVSSDISSSLFLYFEFFYDKS